MSKQDPKSVRVKAFLPLEVKGVPPEELEKEKVAILFGPKAGQIPLTPTVGLDRQELLEKIILRLDQLEHKIDLLLTDSRTKMERQHLDQATHLEICEDEIILFQKEARGIGEVYRLEFLLELFPPIWIKCLSEVSQCQLVNDTHHIHLKFIAISDEQRDAVYRYILSSQRTSLRMEKSKKRGE